MTKAEDKAKELIEKFALYTNTEEELEDAKQCAIIACREILELKLIEDKDLQETTKAYWKEVKTIITNY